MCFFLRGQRKIVKLSPNCNIEELKHRMAVAIESFGPALHTGTRRDFSYILDMLPATIGAQIGIVD